MKIFPKIFIIIILILGAQNLYAQTNNEKAAELNKLAITENNNNNFDKAAEYIEEAIKITPNEQDFKLDGELRYTAALIYANKKEESLSLKYFLSSASFFEKTDDFGKLSEIFAQTQLIYFQNEAFEKAAENGKKSLLYHKKNKSPFAKLSNVIEKTGDSYFYLPKIDSAIIYYSLLKNEAKKNNNNEKKISALIKLSKSYKILKDYNNALQANIELNEIYLKKQDYAGMAVSTNNIAYNYMLLKEYTKATAGFFAAIALSNKTGGSDDFIANTYLNIGVCMQNNNNLQDAITNINKAVEIRKKNNENTETAKALNILSLTYFNAGDLYNAATHCEESIEFALKSGNKQVLSDCYRTYSMILQEGNDYETALEIYKKHLAISDSLMMEQKIHDHKLAQRIFELERSEKELKLKLADDQVKNLALKQLILESEKKENELELLKKDKELEASEKERLLQIVRLAEEQNKTLLKEQEIKNLEAQKALQELQLKQKEIEKSDKEKEVALLHSESDKQKLLLEKQKEEEQKLRWIFGLVIIISILILYALMISRKANKKLAKQKRQIQEKNEELKLQNEEIKAQKEYLQDANNEISIQKQQIEIKNEEITSSIKYAERIQAAILPPLEIINHDFKEYFILYKPKDIVSGDFYWSKKIGDNTVIAIADCTGHGVPGAFMSMLGISFLNEITTNNDFLNAAEILNNLREKVKAALRQTGRTQEQKDGMDISLIILNKEEMTLQFSGANNSLLRIRNNKEDIIKADRMPIGIHHKEKLFTNHSEKLIKGDVLYAYSDGYQDQFGGKNGRKFLSSKFKSLLLEIHQKPAQEQKMTLENKLAEWMSFKDQTNNQYTQVDDILVFGIKI